MRDLPYNIRFLARRCVTKEKYFWRFENMLKKYQIFSINIVHFDISDVGAIAGSSLINCPRASLMGTDKYNIACAIASYMRAPS